MSRERPMQRRFKSLMSPGNAYAASIALLIAI